jgi:DNA-binding SARP family transcriptional activator
MVATTTSPVRTFVLGEFAIAVGDGAPVVLHGMPAQILALLALDPGRAVPTAHIVERIWAPDPPERAAARLHVHISRIRRMLDELGCADVLRTRNDGYALDVDPGHCDHVRFERQATAGLDALRAGDHAGAAAALAAAIALWQGPALGAIGDRPWAQIVVARLDDLRRQVVDAWAQAHLALGEHVAVVTALERQLAEDPLRETSSELLMTALYRGGRQADALAVYIRLRDALGAELGLDPSPALHAAYLAILRHDPALATIPIPRQAPGPGSGPVAGPVTDLPPRIAGLVGRAADLAAIEDTAAARDNAAAGDHDGPRVVVLVGMGGVGKSRLALEVAHRAAGRGELAWWVPAGETVAAVEALGDLARALGVPEHADQTVMLTQLWDELRRRDRWTLVYDDCPDPEAFVALRPPAGDGVVVVTSRHHGWGRIGHGIAVDVLGGASSVQILTSSSGDDNPAAAAELAEQMGGLPLALVQAAAFVEETGMTLAQYAGLFRRRRIALLSRSAPDDHAVGVAATWDMSLDTIALRAPAAAELLELCCALGPARVPLDLLTGAVDVLDGPLGAVVADELLLEDMIAELLRFSVVGRGRDGLLVHPLLRAVVLGRLPADRLDRARLRADAVLTRAMPAAPEDPATWMRWARWVPHALDLAGRHAESGDGERAVPLFANASRYLGARALFRTARTAADRALACAAAAWGDTDQRLVQHRTHLGLMYERLGDLPAARRLQEEALELLRARAPDDPRPQAAVLMRLGGVLACQRDLLPALAAFQQVRALLADADAPHETGRCLAEMALVQWMLGRPEAALEHFDAAIATLDATVGRDHPDTVHARSGLAVVLQDLDQVGEAYALQSAVVTSLTAVLGPAHPDVAHAHDKLGYMAGLLGRHQAALDGHTRASAILQDVYGPDHVELGMPITNMGVMHLALGELAAAGIAQERARALFADGYGPHHPHTALATWRLATVRARQGRLADAERLLEAALADTVAGLGAEHPDVERIRTELAACRARSR